jgi:Icc protein
MRIHTLAHVSDLHLGAGSRAADMTRAIADTLIAAKVDHVVVTGDMTNRGRNAELDAYHDAFAPLIASGRVTSIPGNHDRLGDDVRNRIMDGARVQIETAEGLHLVRVDSTGPHNRRWLQSHGILTKQDVHAIDEALDEAAPDALRVVLLHHHPVPLPEDSFAEKFPRWFGRPFTLELSSGAGLLERIVGRCDLVLHGHRHVPSARHIGQHGDRPMIVCNAGSSTQLGRVRLFAHRDGGLCLSPMWLDVAADTHAVERKSFRDFVGLAAARAGFEESFEQAIAYAENASDR